MSMQNKGPRIILLARFCLLVALQLSFFLGCICTTCAAEQVNLDIGSNAPELYIAKTVKGESVVSFEKGTIYVVEFWASWCSPCISEVPHLSLLQRTLSDIKVISINSREKDQNAAEAVVNKFGDLINYSVLMDEQQGSKNGLGKSYENWVLSAGLSTVPCAFIVDKNTKIAWIGHPAKIDRVLLGVVAGTYDAYSDAVFKEREQVRIKLEADLWSAINSKDAEGTKRAIDLLCNQFPEQVRYHGIRKYNLLKRQDRISALAWATEMAKLTNNEWEPLNELALHMLVEDPDSNDELTIYIAGKIAAQANEILQQYPLQEDGLYAQYRARSLETMAALYAARNEKDNAIRAQREAIEIWDSIRQRMVKARKTYQSQ